MADEREQSEVGGGSGGKDQVQTPGGQANGAQPLDAAPDNGGVERYPAVRQDDAVEATGRTEQVTGQLTGQSRGEDRSFDASADAATPGTETPVTGEGDLPVSANEGRLGPGADPAEGAR